MCNYCNGITNLFNLYAYIPEDDLSETKFEKVEDECRSIFTMRPDVVYETSSYGYIKNGHLSIHTYDREWDGFFESANVTLNYCPMCGRPLNGFLS